MKKQFGLLLLFAICGVLVGCGVGRQVSDAKTFGECRYDLASIDSVYISGIDIREFKNIRSFQDLDLARYPRIAMGLLRRDVPLDLRVNVDITNPTKKRASIKQIEYKVLLGDSEIFSGFLNQLIEVMPGTARTRVPVKLSANIYALINNDQTRNDLIDLITTLTGKTNAKPSRLVVKIRPTLDLGGKQINYPGYITFDKVITSDLILSSK
jgi:hypothetical protein